MNLLLVFIAVAQIGDEVSPANLEDWYKKNQRYPVLSTTMAVGELGVLPYRLDPRSYASFIETEILQILSDDTLLLTVRIHDFVQVDRRAAVLSPRHTRTTTVMVKGKSTRRNADGDEVQVPGWFRVEGTESHESATGKRTVRVLRPFRNAATDAIDADLAKKAEDEANAPARAGAEAKAAAEAKEKEKAELARKQAAERKETYRRTWTTRDGKFSVDAYFVDQESGSVTLERASDGKMVTISTSLLSAVDIDKARLLKLKKKGEP